MNDAPMDDVLAAMADASRRQILQLVASGEMSAGDIAARFTVTRPAISQHLAVLRAAGLVVDRRDGTRRLYRLRPDGLTGLRAFLGELWPETLASFKAAAEGTDE